MIDAHTLVTNLKRVRPVSQPDPDPRKHSEPVEVTKPPRISFEWNPFGTVFYSKITKPPRISFEWNPFETDFYSKMTPRRPLRDPKMHSLGALVPSWVPLDLLEVPQ